MARKFRRSRKKIVPQRSIERIAAEGKAITHTDEGKIIFVDDGIPGDVADILLHRNKKDYAIGKVASLHTPSPLRQDAFCQHFGVCGGCKWQHISYPQQLNFKMQIVTEALKRVGKLQHPSIMPILGSAESVFYRNKMEFTASNRRWLTEAEIAEQGDAPIDRRAIGLHIPGQYNRIVDITTCYLQADPSNAIRNSVRQYAIDHNIEFYDIENHTGLLRTLIIRTTSIGQVMVVVAFGNKDDAAMKGLLQFLEAEFPSITSLNYVINTKKNDTLFDQDIICYAGKAYIEEQLSNVTYRISPKSFFQTNSSQAKVLYDTVLKLANLAPTHNVYDLYTGTGSIALYVAKHCKQVVGIEEVPQAIADAKINAELNNIANTHFYAGDVKTLLTSELTEQHGRPDVLITDPPRAGMHADVVQSILQFEPQRIVYVSCNPVTQARDMALLAEKYEITHLQPVDMFPHTYHIENVAALRLK